MNVKRHGILYLSKRTQAVSAVPVWGNKTQEGRYNVNK